MRIFQVLLAVSTSALLAGCQATGEQYRSDVYQPYQVNTAQEVATVDIIAIQPARVAVDNTSNQRASQVAGGILGGIIGGVIGNNVDRRGPFGTAVGAVGGAAGGALIGGAAAGSQSMVEGVQLTYKQNGAIYNSTQVGRMCEFKYGPAIMISTQPGNTRIQPNNPNGC